MARPIAWMLWVSASLAAPGKADQPKLTSSVAAGGRIAADEVLTLTLSRPLTPEEGRFAVLVGNTDWTSLFEVGERTLVFRPRSLPLPHGVTRVVVYGVSRAGEWRELAGLPLEVVSPRAFDRALVKPTIDVAFKAQFAEGHTPETNAPERPTFGDATSQISVQTDHARGGLGLKTSVKVVGVSHQPEALRFSSKGPDAPRLDLAAHAVALDGRGVALRLGELVTGSHRHLISGFRSRGSSLRLGLGKRGDLNVAAVAGSKLVGWDDLLGIATPEHRLFAATLGLEAVGSHPGRLRIEASVLDGSRLPIASYNQGVVNDAEESEGVGLRVVSAEARARFRVDAGWSRSRSSNPEDPLLSQGSRMVPVERAVADAWYVDAKLDLLRTLAAGEREVTLTAGGLHERVDPLYRSVGATLSPNRLSSTVTGALRFGEAAVVVTRARARDNLDRIPSLLTTLTRQEVVDLTVPFTVFQPPDDEPSPWLPLLTYQWNRVRQFGDGLPPDSGFNETHVPDQLNIIQAGGLAWQGAKASLAYAVSLTRQDNRQPGRETADFHGRTHSLTLGLMPSESVDFTLELALERQQALQRAELQRLARVGVGASARLPQGFGLMALVSHTTDETAALGADASTIEGEIQASWRRGLRSDRQKPALTLFVRCARQAARLRDRLQGLDDDRSGWQLATGLSLSAF